MPITVHSNLSLYAIPVAYSLAFIPHTIKVGLMISNGLQFNNLNPRASTESSLKAAKAEVNEQVSRLGNIHTNSLEIFPLFAAAVIVGNFSRLSSLRLNQFAGLFVASRLAYSAIYFFQATQLAATARSATFFVGLVSSLTVLVQSANKVFSLGPR